MPIVVTWIMSALSGVIGTLVLRVIAALGVAFVSYQGIKEAFDAGSAAVNSTIGGAPADVIAMFKIFGIWTALQIYMAGWGGAIAAKSAFRVLRFRK